MRSTSIEPSLRDHKTCSTGGQLLTAMSRESEITKEDDKRRTGDSQSPIRSAATISHLISGTSRCRKTSASPPKLMTRKRRKPGRLRARSVIDRVTFSMSSTESARVRMLSKPEQELTVMIASFSRAREKQRDPEKPRKANL